MKRMPRFGQDARAEPHSPKQVAQDFGHHGDRFGGERCLDVLLGGPDFVEQLVSQLALRIALEALVQGGLAAFV